MLMAAASQAGRATITSPSTSKNTELEPLSSTAARLLRLASLEGQEGCGMI